jgi:hypothetical protein
MYHYNWSTIGLDTVRLHLCAISNSPGLVSYSTRVIVEPQWLEDRIAEVAKLFEDNVVLISTAADLSQPPADALLRSTHSHCSFRYSYSQDTDWSWPELRSRILIINRTVLSAQTQIMAVTA